MEQCSIFDVLKAAWHAVGRADGITAIFTAAAAVATAVLAYLTREAIREGQGQRKETNEHFEATRKQDKQHHEDTFRPIVVLTPSNIMDTLDRQKVLHPDPSEKTLLINCTARNIGAGAALNIRLSVRGEGRKDFGPSRELTPMSAGDVRENRNGHILIDVLLTDSFNGQDLKNLPNSLWVIVLEYEDVFGNPFHTIHSKEKGKRWAVVDRGFAPDTTPTQMSA